MDTTQFLIHRALRRLQSDVDMALISIARASRLCDVTRATSVHIRPELRHTHVARAQKRRLEMAGEKRAAAICHTHLENLRAATETPAAFQKLAGDYRVQWEALRGYFPKLYVETIRAYRSVHLGVAVQTQPTELPSIDGSIT